MTNKLVVIINNLKVPKNWDFTMWNEISCTKLQLPPEFLTRGLLPPDTRSLCLLSSTEFLEPPLPNKIPGYATDTKDVNKKALSQFQILCRHLPWKTDRNIRSNYLNPLTAKNVTNCNVRWCPIWRTNAATLRRPLYAFRHFNLITLQQDVTYSVYYISVGSSTCFGCWHPSSGARTTVITASVVD